jgi:valyl-tRNA synthetase
MEPRFDYKKLEEEIYKIWENSGFFNPDKLPKSHKRKYVICIPPPNITGTLHMGHAFNSTIQDILIRFQRMRKRKTLWVPGTDHAGIATQNKVEKELKKENLTRQQLGREKFLERVWKWVKDYKIIILNQFKKLGCSLDWSRERFTLDKDYSNSVLFAFLHYYKKGYIYRGPRIVNWCPRCQSAISDIEIKYKEKRGKLWYIKYKLKSKDQFIIIATTRPETILGDTGIAFNPKDERYKGLEKEKAIVPIVEREVKIVKSVWVDPNFGTGLVKITPAHDILDAKIGKQHNLPVINVIGPDGRMTKSAGKDFEGLTVLEAREKFLEKLKEKGLIEKEEDYIHRVPVCERCETEIEPQISEQWFIKMEKLAKLTEKAVKEGKIKIIPKRCKKLLLDWLKNVEDWCISRQIWWGHRLPVFFCEKNPQKFIVSLKKPKKCPFCKECKMVQSEDVLDTWFSSALWPFAVFGWPKKTSDLKKFYPTDFLTTAQEIIFLWVARMIFSSLEFTRKVPFKTVYIHPTILNIEGKRMSKSLGTGVNPVDLIEKYGADATRFGIIFSLTRKDQQAIKFDERNIISGRNFLTKLWNIARFVHLNTQDIKEKLIKTPIPKTLADRWILSRLHSTISLVTKQIEDLEFGKAERVLYDFIWKELADVYLELSKFQLKDEKLKKQTQKILLYLLANILKLLHPFCPFVTEKIWIEKFGDLRKKNLLIIAEWPKAQRKFLNKAAEKRIQEIKNHLKRLQKTNLQQTKIQP